MNHFSIKDIENLCGIKAHTLRIWEQRYPMFTTKRKDSNHRIYDNDDLKYLLRISYLYHQGLKISKIAALNPEDVKEKALAILTPKTSYEHYINAFTEASIDFDSELFDETYRACVSLLGIEETVVKVIYPYLQKIGLLWMTDHVIPANEHFTSNLMMRKLIAAIDGVKVPKKTNARKILLFAPAGEQHEIPLLFMHYLYKQNGDDVVYYGPNMNLSEIKLYIEQRPITYLHFHAITQLSALNVDQVICLLLQNYPGKKVVVSGPKAAEAGKHENTSLLLSLEDLMAFCKA
ncbi:MerR family transcriptional regulator [Segetibacter sp. 3557_3]|uniref:MerR family transcriptional regulator n=1 Tax=Segetibacter sp. 3557_3 TaxID=2547429 RepID=UPI001058C930|nr:MerR family transcriptional regulator [Segetibacter sp. 3557_3]TDH28807.1 MerR family transcriptional regulator [Segetibacter sp. 3557_3]